jgi:hypothetical protein
MISSVSTVTRRAVVKLHAAAAVQLYVDKTGGKNGAIDRALLNLTANQPVDRYVRSGHRR